MKILQVIPNLLKGGAQRLVIDICNELTKRNDLQVMLLVLSQSKNEFSHFSTSINIKQIDVNFNLSIFKKPHINLDAYEKVVSEFDPDIIHSHLYFAELICHENVRKNITYVTHFHNNIEQFSKLKTRNLLSKKIIVHFYEKKRIFNKYRKANKIFITISNDCHKFAKKTLNKNISEKIIKLENAINHSLFNPIKIKKDVTKISLINVGNLIKNKNQTFLIDVLEYLVNKGFQATLTLVGDGPLKNKLIIKSKKLLIENNIKLVGAVNNVQDYLWNNNFYVHSAFKEAFGLVLVEAMAAKIPIISFNGDGNQDIIIDNETGFLINSLDAKVFGDTIIKLYNDKNLYDDIIERAYKFSKNYDIKEYSLKLLDIYEKQC